MPSAHGNKLGRLALGVGIGVLGLLFGGGLIVAAFLIQGNTTRLKEHGIRSEAVIEKRWAKEEDRSAITDDIQSETGITCYFHVRYTPVEANEPLSADLFVRQEAYGRYDVGDSVEIAYLAENPSNVETIDYLDSMSASLIGPILLVIFGLLAIGLTGVGSYVFLCVETG